MAMIELSKSSYKPYADKMKKSVHVLQDNLNSIRAGRANPKVLDRIMIDYYGVQTPINQVANVQVPEPRQITISPWDPSVLSAIEKAIQASDLGINPNSDGKMLRLSFPALTEERRKDLAKSVHKYAEETKVAIRNIRREALDKFRGHLKKKEMTEDMMAEVEEEIQELTDKYIQKVDVTIEEKEKDLMDI